MRSFVKCKMCNAEIPADKCVFAARKEVIEGKEYIYCCMIMKQKQPRSCREK